MSEFTSEMLDAEELICKAENATIMQSSWLHIVVEEPEIDDADQLAESMKRLPMFGLKFQDPEEETLIDKLKKEYDVND